MLSESQSHMEYARGENYLFVQARKCPEHAIPIPLKLTYINFFFQNLHIEKGKLAPLSMNLKQVRVFSGANYIKIERG